MFTRILFATLAIFLSAGLYSQKIYRAPVKSTTMVKPSAQMRYTPPANSARKSAGTIILDITTGGDDLRGGKDNFNLVVLHTTGRIETFRNLNGGQRLADNTRKRYTRQLAGNANTVKGIRLETTANGGYSGDNWNVDRINVMINNRTVLTRSGRPVARFTGDNRVEEFTWKATGPVVARAKYTNFKPAIHGFHFSNSFRNRIIADVELNGLCGGMVYAAMDYYNRRRAIPSTRTLPADRSTLQSFIYRRQLESVGSNADKWAELAGTNFTGGRDREFFNWGLQAGSGRLGELTAAIDRGQPVPLGLQTTGANGAPFSHQVLAIGYKLGRYAGDLGAYQTDVEIYVYDPNYPDKITCLKPDPTRMCYYNKANPSKYWRTYFVDRRYQTSNTPAAR